MSDWLRRLSEALTSLRACGPRAREQLLEAARAGTMERMYMFDPHQNGWVKVWDRNDPTAS